MSGGLPTAVLGRTGLEVTRLGLGGAAIRGPDSPSGRPITDEQVNTLLNGVLDAGINFIDTSDDYGRSEEFIGKHISDRRSEYYLATKCGVQPDGGGHLWTRENVFRTTHRSLKLLKTDYVDVMQLHNTTVEECEEGDLVEALEEMRRQGKVRWIAVSTFLPNLPTFLQWGVFDAFQIPYSALRPEHDGWITRSAEAGIGTIVRGGVAQGEPGEGRGREDVWRKYDRAKLDELREEGDSRSAFVLRLTLTHPHIHSIIVGTMSPEHLGENVKSVVSGPLSAEVYDEAKRRLDAVGEKPAETG